MPDVETPGIDVERVAPFLLDHVPGLEPPLRFRLIGGGRSNLTYRVDGSRGGCVLRRPPLGHVLPTAHDMSREFRVLQALADTDVPVPRPLALCEDPERNGMPFYVMEHREGIVIEDRLPEGFADSPESRRAIGVAVAENLARLHAIDPRSVGLADFGRPEGYLDRQLRRWSEQWRRSATEPLPIVDELLCRLAAARPAPRPGGIVHGDYRLGNLALAADDPGRVVAIFDWEMATLGDPLADLGYLLMSWGEFGEPPVTAIGSFRNVTAQPGFLGRTELIDVYARAAGRAVQAVDFYVVLAFTKLAVISEGIWARHLQGKTLGDGFSDLARASVPLAEHALALADASGISALRGR